METYDSRFDGKFEAWLSSASTEGLRWMQAKTARHWIRPWRAARPDEGWDARATDDERRAAALMARLVVRDRLREVWEASHKARSEETALVEGALRGTLGLPAEVAVLVRRLAAALGAGESASLSWRTREVLYVDGIRRGQLRDDN